MQNLTYTYDPVGNIIALRDGLTSHPAISGSNLVSADGLYLYDAIYRLVSAEGREHPGIEPVDLDPDPFSTLPHPNDTQALTRYTETYTYDEVGNIQSMQHSGANGWTRNYAYATDNNRLTATSVPGSPLNISQPYTYDPHGSMVSMPNIQQLDWDYADRLQHTSKSTGSGQDTYFTYDATGQRVRKVYLHNGLFEERLYLGNFELYRRRPNSPGSTVDLERETLHVNDDQRRIAMVETETTGAATPRWRFQLDNHLGSSVMELDQAGEVISYEEYHPYGSTAFHVADGNAQVSAKRYRYTGKERDEETGLYYHGARYYAPWLGRWTAADPLGISEPGRANLNLYAYGSSNPIRSTDPQGTEDRDEVAAARGKAAGEAARKSSDATSRMMATKRSGGGGTSSAKSSSSVLNTERPSDYSGIPVSKTLLRRALRYLSKKEGLGHLNPDKNEELQRQLRYGHPERVGGLEYSLGEKDVMLAFRTGNTGKTQDLGEFVLVDVGISDTPDGFTPHDTHFYLVLVHELIHAEISTGRPDNTFVQRHKAFAEKHRDAVSGLGAQFDKLFESAKKTVQGPENKLLDEKRDLIERFVLEEAYVFSEENFKGSLRPPGRTLETHLLSNLKGFIFRGSGFEKQNGKLVPTKEIQISSAAEKLLGQVAASLAKALKTRDNTR